MATSAKRLIMPAEWAPHARCWMLWPTTQSNWRRKAIPAQEAFLNIAQAIARFEPVTVGVAKQESLSLVRNRFEQHLAAHQGISRHPIEVVEIASNDLWIRDTGPTFVHRISSSTADIAVSEHEAERELVGIDWQFNGWGGAVLDIDLDKEVATQVCALTHTPCLSQRDFVLEGGSIHTDGEGTLLVTEECLLNANRNASWTKQEIETRLRETLGVEKIIWLRNGLAGDRDTDGHIDNICCFSRPGQMLLAWTDDEQDAHYSICRDALAVLESERDARGRTIDIVKLLIPPLMQRVEEDNEDLLDAPTAKENLREVGERLAASYVNFYLPNGGVVAPSYEPQSDARAKEILQSVFPDREVVLVAGREILLGGGNIHCITQQQPL